MKKAKLIDTFEPSKEQVKDLRDGLVQPFWKCFSQILEDEKRDADNQFHDRDGLLTVEQREQFRQRFNLLEYVLELPGLVIEKSKPKREPKEPDDETYD
jgi:hypothetical protein